MYFSKISKFPLLFALQVVTLGGSEAFDMEVNWIITSYESMKATVGDSVTFKYNPTVHNLYIHPSGSCDETGRTMVGENTGDDTYSFTEDDAGTTITFACDVGSHCTAGQILNFTVTPTAVPDDVPPAPTQTPNVAPTALANQSAPTQAPEDGSSGVSSSQGDAIVAAIPDEGSSGESFSQGGAVVAVVAALVAMV